MEIIVKDKKGKVLSKRDVKLKELNLLERGKFLDLVHEFHKDPFSNLFSRAIEFCRLCTDYTDDELVEWSEHEYVQLMDIVLREREDIKKKKSSSK
jgi:hypothetical protein